MGLFQGIVDSVTRLFEPPQIEAERVVDAAMDGPRALIVGDSTTTRFQLARILVAAGFATDEAASQKDAIRKLERTRPDVAIVDARIDGMAGTEFVRRLRGRADLDNVRVVMILPLAAPWDVGAAIEAGADAHLSKPIHANAVLEKIRFVLPMALDEAAVACAH